MARERSISIPISSPCSTGKADIQSKPGYAIPAELEKILSGSFYIRTTLTRRDGTPRTIETTFVWASGSDRIVISGYPGKRDWMASMSRNPNVTVHTVEFEPWFDIAAEARVIRDLDEKLPRVMAFIENWTQRPGFPRTRFRLLLGAVKLNRALRLPWWGPFIIAKRIFSGMPCVEITFVGEPARRDTGGPPGLSEPQEGRPY
ncbi:MAG: hypothetical protein QF357_08205 [Dehalococcoidia bacterium]|jgi:hypothetical protein|nr:hypothetical protein [Dehalococcoidia bacterium]